MSSGALTPEAAVQSIYRDALHHLDEPAQLAFFKNIAGGLQLGLAGLTSMAIAGGCVGITESNPGITDLIAAAIFSTGLITVYMTGAELFTGYPMWLAIAALKRKRRVRQYIVAVINSLVGNMVGTLIVSMWFTYGSQILNDEPQRTYLLSEIDDTITNSEWHVIFTKSVACGYWVTLAMLMGTQNMDGISKALTLWLPFTLSTACQFPHTVKYMYLAPSAMMLGSPLSIGQFLYKCMLPIILGNLVGGAVFTGAYHWWVFLQCENGENKTPTTFRESVNGYRDEED